MPRAFERLRSRRGLRAAPRALGPLAVAIALLATAAGTAQAAGSVRVEVWVWQHAADTGKIRVGAARADGSWPAPEMLPLTLDDVSSSGRYRYGDIAIDVEWRIGAAPLKVQVRVWQHVEDERDIHISARGSLGSWRTLGTVPLALDAQDSPDGCCRAGGVTIEAPLPEGATGAPLRYRFDPAGEAAEPGSYAFLTAPIAREITTYEGLRHDAASVRIEVDENGEWTYTFYTAPRASVITTYEGLRRDAATLRVNAAAADGASSASLFGAVEAGHLVEWFHARDCFVRYRVTAVPAAQAEAPYREFGVRPETYVFQGCQSGSLPTDGTTAAFSAAPELPLAHLGGLSLTAPVIHGIFQLVPAGWTGATRAGEVSQGPGGSHKSPIYTESLTEARTLPYWREPEFPEGWRLDRVISGGLADPAYSYTAEYVNGQGYPAFTLKGYHADARYYAEEASWNNGNSVKETVTIEGRPAVVAHGGPDYTGRRWPVTVWVYDEVTESEHKIIASDWSLTQGSGNAGAVIAIARCLFE